MTDRYDDDDEESFPCKEYMYSVQCDFCNNFSDAKHCIACGKKTIFSFTPHDNSPHIHVPTEQCCRNPHCQIRVMNIVHKKLNDFYNYFKISHLRKLTNIKILRSQKDSNNNNIIDNDWYISPYTYDIEKFLKNSIDNNGKILIRCIKSDGKVSKNILLDELLDYNPEL